MRCPNVACLDLGKTRLRHASDQTRRRRAMKIGVIGAGNIGATAAKLFIKAEHEVAISNSRGPETLRDVVAELGERARALTVEEAAKFGEVVLISIPFVKYKSLPPAPFYGKVVIDSNNYYPSRDGSFADLDSGKTT